MLNNTIEYDELRFGERHDSVISAIRSFSVKLAGAVNQGISALVLIISGIYTVSQNISGLEIEVGKGGMNQRPGVGEGQRFHGAGAAPADAAAENRHGGHFGSGADVCLCSDPQKVQNYGRSLSENGRGDRGAIIRNIEGGCQLAAAFHVEILA